MTKKKENKLPTREDYSELIKAIDLLIEMFQQVEKETPEMVWHSIRLTSDMKNTDYVWPELLGDVYKKELSDLGGTTSDDPDEPFWVTTYAVTGKGVTLEDWYKVRDVCLSAVKSLLLISRPPTKTPISTYLDDFGKVRSHIQKSKISVSGFSWCLPCWFEFIYNVADEIGCPIRVSGGPITTASYKKIPYRTIGNSICEASILALKFLKNTLAAEKPAETGQSQRAEIPSEIEIEKISEMIGKLEALTKAKERYQVERLKLRWDRIDLENALWSRLVQPIIDEIDLVELWDCIIENGSGDWTIAGIKDTIRSREPNRMDALIQEFKLISRRLEIKTQPAGAEQDTTHVKEGKRWNSNRRWWHDPKWAVMIIVMVLLAAIGWLGDCRGWWDSHKNGSVISPRETEYIDLDEDHHNKKMMSERLKLEQIMKTYRDKRYDAIILSLQPSRILETYHAFKTKSDTEKIELIARICITEGGNCRNSDLFKGKINSESRVSLEYWEAWMENYEDTDENGVLVDDKIDSKIGAFVKKAVSEWYYLCKEETKNMDPKEKEEYSLKLIKQAIEHTYKTALPQTFDREMINTFITEVAD